MKFFGYHDFYKQRSSLRYQYINLTTSDKYLYKYYVYSRRYLKERTCNMIWEYLNCADEFELECVENKLYEEWFRYE